MALFLISPTLQLFRKDDSLVAFVIDACSIGSPQMLDSLSLRLPPQGLGCACPTLAALSWRMGTGLIRLPTSYSEVASCLLHPFLSNLPESPIPWACVSSLQLGSPAVPQGALTKPERKPCHPDLFSPNILVFQPPSHHPMSSLGLSVHPP